jgi:hypothetical protein
VGEAQDHFKLFLDSQIWPTLQEQGFRRQRGNFWLNREGNWGLLHFQKSQFSSAGDVRFTIEVGAASERLRHYVPQWAEGRRPAITDCLVRERIGLVADGNDRWWKIGRETGLDGLGSEVRNLLAECGLPFLEPLLTDEGLLDYYWSPEYHKRYGTVLKRED